MPPRSPANWLDRVIGVVAPGAALRRVRSRAAFEAEVRGYDGASRDRRTEGWRTAATSADAELAVALPILRERMRDLVRNNPHAAKAVSTIVTHAVGTGIFPTPKSGDDKADKAIAALFEAWSSKAHSKGKLDFYGLQTLICREFVEAGEVLVRRRLRRLSDGLPVPLQLQLLEADLLDGAKDGALGSTATAVQGVEFDALDRPVAYWLLPRHPGGSLPWLRGGGTGGSVRVPAADILHVFEMQRDQARGAPWGSPVVQEIRSLGEYRDAELERKKIEACAVGAITGDSLDPDGGIGLPLPSGETRPGAYDTADRLVEAFEPGMFLTIRGGRDVKFFSPAQTGSYEAYKRASIQDIAAGFRTPYELISGDLAHVSYISGRLGMQEFYRLMEQVQWQILIPMACQPIWDWFCEAAFFAGAIARPSWPVEWSPPPMPAVDPLKTAMADLIDVRAGFRSHPEVVRARGRNHADVVAEIAASNAALDAAGLVLDSDPRRVAKSGAIQAAEAAATAADETPARAVPAPEPPSTPARTH